MVLNVMGGGDGDLGGDAVGTDDVVLMLVKILVEASNTGRSVGCDGAAGCHGDDRGGDGSGGDPGGSVGGGSGGDGPGIADDVVLVSVVVVIKDGAVHSWWCSG